MNRPTDDTINYVEFPMHDPDAIKAFYETAFAWRFTVWGPDYLSFSGAGLEGGFNREQGVNAQPPGALVILYAHEIEEKQALIAKAGGEIIKPIYAFPGGRRFHFKDPAGNELAVWSAKDAPAASPSDAADLK